MPLWRSWWPEIVRSTFNNQMRTGIGSPFRLYLLNFTQNSLIHFLSIMRMRNISAIMGKYKAVPPIGGHIVSMKKHQNKASRKVGWLLCFRSLESASRWSAPLKHIRKPSHPILNRCICLKLPRGLIWSLWWLNVGGTWAEFRPQASQATINSIKGQHHLIIYLSMTSFGWFLVELCTLGLWIVHIANLTDCGCGVSTRICGLYCEFCLILLICHLHRNNFQQNLVLWMLLMECNNQTRTQTYHSKHHGGFILVMFRIIGLWA